MKQGGAAATKDSRGDEASPPELAVGGFQHALRLCVAEIGAFPRERKNLCTRRSDAVERGEQAADVARDAGARDVKRIGVEADAKQRARRESGKLNPR